MDGYDSDDFESDDSSEAQSVAPVPVRAPAIAPAAAASNAAGPPREAPALGRAGTLVGRLASRTDEECTLALRAKIQSSRHRQEAMRTFTEDVRRQMAAIQSGITKITQQNAQMSRRLATIERDLRELPAVDWGALANAARKGGCEESLHRE